MCGTRNLLRSGYAKRMLVAVTGGQCAEAYREGRRTFAGLDASGSEAPWFPLVFRSSQTEPLIGNYLPAQRSRRSDHLIRRESKIERES